MAVSYALTSLASLDAARDLWQSLADGGGNLFATWEWASAWWETYGDGRDQRLIAAGPRDEAPHAILPLYVALAGPMTVLRFVGHSTADMVGPVCRPADR